MKVVPCGWVPCPPVIDLLRLSRYMNQLEQRQSEDAAGITAGFSLRRWGRLHGGWAAAVLLIASAPACWAQWMNFTKNATPLPGAPLHTRLTKAVADMDGDGRDDIIRMSLDGSVAILRQQASGVWQLQQLAPSGTQPLATMV